MNEITLPVFPIPDVILFPRVLLPLHIFESRYRKMVDDLMEKPEDERLVIISNLYFKDMPKGENPFAHVATIGKMIHVEKLDDGRSNIIIYGQFTAEVEEVKPSPEPYRMGRIIDIRQEFWPNPQGSKKKEKKELLDAIHKFAERTKTTFDNIRDIELDDLINGLAFSLNLDGDYKQMILEESDLEQRLSILIDTLDMIGYYKKFIPEEDEYTNIN